MKNPNDFAPQPLPAAPGREAGFAPDIRLDYGALLDRMLRNWYWFVLAVGLCIGLAWLNLRYTIPVYRAYTSVLIQESSGGQAGLSKEVIAEEFGFENSYVIDNEIYMLRSNFLMERVVDMLGLDISYVHQGAVRNTEIYQPEAFSLLPVVDTLAGDNALVGDPIDYGSVKVRFDNALAFSLIRGEGDTISQRYGEPFPIGNRDFKLVLTEGGKVDNRTDIYAINVMDPSRVATSYASKLNVSQVERSGVVDMSLNDPIPAKARDILNTLILVYEQQIIEQQSMTGGQTLSFLEERLDFVTDELYEVESNVASFKRSANLSVDLQTQGSDYLQRMNTAESQLAELRVRRDLIEDIQRTLTSSDNEYEPLPIASEVISGILADLIVQYNQQIFERNNRLESVTAAHPLVATAEENLDNLKRSILRSINAVLRETKERIAKVEERIEPLSAQMSRIPGNEQRLLQIMRQQEIKQNLFMYLLEKREEAALTIAAQVPNTRIIDRAKVTPYPISPNKTMMYLMAFGVGLFVPAGIIFLREMLGTTLGSEREVSSYLPYPVVGRIVKNPTKDDLVVSQSNRSGLAEAFRLLRTNLGFLLPSEQPAVILVTSSVSGEGKSFISSNLGAALALSKKRVAVVGMDMRKPKLAEMVLADYNSAKQPTGLSSYLIGKSTYEEVVMATEQENMWLIPSGPLPPNPAELLMEGRMASLIHRLQQDFDIIILDSPPVGIVTDGLLMKDYIDVTLFVTRVGVTPKKSMSYIAEMAASGKLPRFNLIVNGIDPRQTYGHGYGYYE
jgi:capsular exopolysaccharide synthesis family protein